MQSLANRHLDRAQRKADNSATSEPATGGIGNVANLMLEAQTAFAGLNDAQKSELKEVLQGHDGFANPDDAYNDAFDGTGNLKTAGIGVVNPLISPATAAAVIESESGNAGANGSGGWGDAFKSDLEPGENANGKAVSEVADAPQGGTEGNGGGDAPTPPAAPATGGKGKAATPAS